MKDASVKLTPLSGNQSPLLELFSLASTNTAVDDPAVNNFFQPVQTVVPPGSTDKFIAPPNQNYMKALIALQTADRFHRQSTRPAQRSGRRARASPAQAGHRHGAQMAQAFRLDHEGHVDATRKDCWKSPSSM